jgi:hypothetical protein
MILARRAAGSGDLAAAAGGRGEIWVARREGWGGGGGWELMRCGCGWGGGGVGCGREGKAAAAPCISYTTPRTRKSERTAQNRVSYYTSGVRGGARGHALRARERVHLFGFGIEAGPFRIFRKFGTGKFRFLK